MYRMAYYKEKHTYNIRCMRTETARINTRIRKPNTIFKNKVDLRRIGIWHDSNYPLSDVFLWDPCTAKVRDQYCASFICMPSELSRAHPWHKVILSIKVASHYFLAKYFEINTETLYTYFYTFSSEHSI